MFFGLVRPSGRKSEPEYAPLDKGCSEDEDGDRSPVLQQDRSKIAKKLIRVFVAAHILILPAGAVLWYMGRQEPMNKSLKEVSFYSPLLDRINIPLALRFDEPQTIAGGHGDMTWGSPPNPEIDKMWEEIVTESSIAVTESEIIAMKKDPSVAVMLPEKYHFGTEKTYLGHALVFHRIHCLDYIRRALYKDYYYPNGTEQVPMHDRHIAHCIAMVLDHLTCAGDPGVYGKLAHAVGGLTIFTAHMPPSSMYSFLLVRAKQRLTMPSKVYQWYDHTEVPLPDANTWGKCWDFNVFRKDFDKIALKDLNPLKMRKPPGAKSVTEHNNLQEIIYHTSKNHGGHA